MVNEPEPGRTRNGSHGGVHRCHKCGWPYPNPHPSAKHRRSHKRACGTLEGYKLLPSSIACDDIEDNRSDEDHKVTDAVESQSNGKSIRFSGSGSMSNRSTDEVFSDAIPEFQDCASSSDNERGEGDNRVVSADATLERDLSASLSFKDCSDADSFELLGYSSDGSQEQSPFVQHSIPNLPHTSLNCQNPALRSTKESLHMPINDRNGSVKTLAPVKLEKEMDECVIDENADQVSKVESNSNGRVEVTSAAVMTDDDVKEPRQECTGGLGADVSVICQEKDLAVDIIQVRKEALPETDSVGSVRSNACFLSDDEDHESVHALLVPDNVPAVEKAEVMLGCQETVKFQQPVTLPSPEPNSSTHALEDNSRLEDETRTETKVVTVEEGGATENGRLDSSEVEKGCEVCFVKEQEDRAIQRIDSFESDSKDSFDVNSMHQVDPEMTQHDNSAGIDDVSNLEKVGSNARIFAEIGAAGLANSKDDEDFNGIREGPWKSDTNKTKSIMQDEVATLDSQEGSNEDDKVVDVLRTSISATYESILDAKSLKSSAAADGGQFEKSVGVSSESNEVCLQRDLDNSSAKNQSHRSEADLSVELGSQEDSLEGNCSSSYAVSTVDTEPVAEKARPLERGDASPGHHSDKPDTFEEPSFMRWVQPGARNSESPEEALDHPRPSRAGWFPLLATNVANVSPGRRKNEERIAKVANWSVKQQLPLKNLLGEAKAEASPKSPPARSGENQASLATEGKLVSGMRTGAITVGAILSSEAHVEESGAQEWSSPVRHSAAVKRERKRVRPYWAQLVCCTASPVNY